MSDENSSINDIVSQHAAKVKEKESGSSSQNTEKEKEVIPDGGGSGNDNSDPPPPKAEDAVSGLLKELNIDSVEALKEKLKPKDPVVEEGPEEKERKKNIYEANLQSYAVEQGVMKLEDFQKINTIKGKEDKDLVFDEFAAGYKEDNAAATDQEIKEAFDLKYDLQSENPALKKWAEKQITKQAKLIREPLESSLNTAKKNYDEELGIRSTYPEYSKKIIGLVDEAIPTKVNVFKDKVGDEEIPVDVELTAEDRKEIAAEVLKEINNQSTFSAYKKNDEAGIKKLIGEKVEAKLWSTKYREKSLKKIADTFLRTGGKNGSTTGAENSFAAKQDIKTQTGPKTTQSKEDEVLDSFKKK